MKKELIIPVSLIKRLRDVYRIDSERILIDSSKMSVIRTLVCEFYITEDLRVSPPNDCDPDKILDVLTYIATGTISNVLRYGNCSEEIRFLGVEYYFKKNPYYRDDSKEIEYKLPDSEFDIALNNLCYGQEIPTRDYHEHRLRMDRCANVFTCPRAASQEELTPLSKIALNEFAENDLFSSPNDRSCMLSPKDKISSERLAFEKTHKALLNLIPTAPWLCNSMGGGIILAGGSIGSLLTNTPPKDYDIFICVPAPESDKTSEYYETAVAHIIEKTIYAIVEIAHARDSVYVSVLPHVISIKINTNPNSGGCAMEYQIIRRRYASPAHVIAGFDIDCCRVVFDGAQLLADYTGMRAWKHGVNLYDATTLSTTAVLRYTKKFKQGMGILIPGVPQSRVERVRSDASINLCDSRESLTFETWSLDNVLNTLKLKHKHLAAACCMATADNIILCTLFQENKFLSDVYNEIYRQASAPTSDYFSDRAREFMILAPWTSIFKEPTYNSARVRKVVLHPKHQETLRRFDPTGENPIVTDATTCMRENRMFTGAFNPIDVDIYTKHPVVDNLIKVVSETIKACVK